MCEYCALTCEYLSEREIEFVFMNMDEDPVGLTEAKAYYTHRTVPIILSSDTETGNVSFVGGYDDLVKGLES